MNKKGIFFTFAAIFLIIILIALFTSNNAFKYKEKSAAISSRIKTMDSFITDFEKDIGRELYIGGYRSLISVNVYLRDIQGYVPDFQSVFSEILVNGTANGTAMSIMNQDGQGADVTSWLVRVNEESSKMNIKVELNIHDVSLKQYSPWNVTVLFNTTVNITDSKNLASWTFEKVYSVQFPIIGFEDPLYIIATSDRMANTINITPNFDFVDDATKNPTVLNAHLKQSYYFNSSLAPSFIMRFSGNFSPSPYGIESMVDLDDYFAQFSSYKKRSVIDYIYFGNDTTVDYCNVTSPVMPTWFRIDINHTAMYEADKLNMTLC